MTGTVAPRRGRSVWSVGIYQGDSPLSLAPVPGLHNPVLTRESVKDVDAAFVADPFMLRAGDLWYLFCEVKNARTRHGEIGLATSQDGHHWDYCGTILREPFHLSYPCVFQWNGGFFMTMETLAAEAVWLYEAVRFPDTWRKTAKLVPGVYADPTIFMYEDQWWMFACDAPYRHDTLSLFLAESPLGPWRQHPQSPIVQGNSAGARPGGRPIVWNGGLYRFAQDCVAAYGTKVRAYAVDRLTPETYLDHEVPQSPVLLPREPWNSAGMHHVDPHQLPDGRWIACVDGYFTQPVPAA
jgi:hypothetical protein